MTTSADKNTRRSHKRKSRPRLLAASFGILLTAVGCATGRGAASGLVLPIEDDRRTLHYLVLGFGIVSVPASPEAASVTATRLHSVGLAISDQPGLKLGLGYVADSVVVVPADAPDVRVELSQVPGGPLTLEAPAACFVITEER